MALARFGSLVLLSASGFDFAAAGAFVPAGLRLVWPPNRRTERHAINIKIVRSEYLNAGRVGMKV